MAQWCIGQKPVMQRVKNILPGRLLSLKQPGNEIYNKSIDQDRIKLFSYLHANFFLPSSVTTHEWRQVSIRSAKKRVPLPGEKVLKIFFS